MESIKLLSHFILPSWIKEKEQLLIRNQSTSILQDTTDHITSGVYTDDNKLRNPPEHRTHGYKKYIVSLF